jgi:putative FmdB family regulatory protein
MPTYVYACDACGKQFEKFQSFKEEPLTTCLCGQSGQVRRVFQPVGVVFKGSGWYITDSRKGDSSASSPETKSDAKAETKTESKAETSEKPSSSSDTSASPPKAESSA